MIFPSPYSLDYFEEASPPWESESERHPSGAGGTTVPPATGEPPFRVLGMAGETFTIVAVVATVATLVAAGTAYK